MRTYRTRTLTTARRIEAEGPQRAAAQHARIEQLEAGSVVEAEDFRSGKFVRYEIGPNYSAERIHDQEEGA